MKNNLQNYGQRWGVKQVVATALALLLVLFLLPLLLFGTGGLEQTEQAAPTGELPIDRTVVTPSPSADSQTQIRVALTDGSVLTLGLDQYLWRVVAAEMPASFELEALKAQAAAARTYTLSKLGRTVEKHPDADVCTDITCCQAYIDPDQAAANWGDNGAAYTAKITSAVSETDGMAVLYDGHPIQAVFFSSAAGRTVDAVEVWGNSVPYLTGVDSPEGDEVPNYHSTVTFTLEEFKSKLLAQYPDADLSGDPAGWFQNTVPNSAGGVEQVDVGGVTVSGGALRTLLGLRSTSFTVTADSQGVTFSVTGYGHGVGMSQYGANALAKQGKTYDEILKWYYTGVEVAPYTPGG
ncbi:stage II sporulation protein D [Flavonifractor sp. An306]|uniref:stage II sporulation protein D n=1 Tax=Flavonifractor sp. An306 TaxID=1965629 RepID=UPI001FA8232B|nr:stage II sporulation protein D [Flavonifractor sp. An306]